MIIIQKLIMLSLFGIGVALPQALAEDQKMIVLDSSSQTPAIFDSESAAVVVFTMGGDQRPDEDKTTAFAACGMHGGVLERYYQVAAQNGGKHGIRTYVSVCTKQSRNKREEPK